MTKSVLIGNAPRVSLGITQYLPFCGHIGISIVEDRMATQVNESITFSNMRMKAATGLSGSVTYTFQDNLSDGNQTFTLSGSPDSDEDTTHTDALTSGDTFLIQSGGSGTGPDECLWAANMECASGYGSFHGCYSPSSVVDVASTTSYLMLAGGVPLDGLTLAARGVFRNRAYDSWESLEIFISANARTNNSVFKSNINGSAGSNLVITVGSGATGRFVDTDAESLSDGDDVCVEFALGTGVDDLSVCHAVGFFKSSDEKQEILCGYMNNPSGSGLVRSSSHGTEHFFTIGGELGSLTEYTSEATARMKLGFAGTLSNLRMLQSGNSYTSNATVTLYKNGSSAITLTIVSGDGGTRWTENSSDTVSFDADDEFSLSIVGGTSGTLNMLMFAVTTSQVVAYSIAAAGGSYTLTGTVADPELHTKVDAVAGSYTLTGTTADLEFNRLVTADAGSYILTGTVADLKFNKAVAADVGSYTLTGTAVGLFKGFPIVAEAGSYALTGTVADLEFHRAVSANSGSYTLTGSDVNLRAAGRIVAEAGAYTLTGQDSSLEYHRVVAADAGSLAISGAVAGLLKTNVLAAETDSYSITGDDVEFIAERLLQLDPGKYVIQGYDALLSHQGFTSSQPKDNVWSSTARKPSSWTEAGHKDDNW